MAQVENSPLLKQLASSDPDLRDEALSSLRTFLTRAQPFSTPDLLKIHKYLFYAVYMSDGPHAQQQLCRDLASLIAPLPNTTSSAPCLSEPNVLPFLETFWQTMAREWKGLDRLRMDKYLLLVRLILRAMFAHLKGKGWEKGLVEEHILVLQKWPFWKEEDGKMPRGLTYHVLDCWTDELDAVAGDELEAQASTNQNHEQGQAKSPLVPLDVLREAVAEVEKKAVLKTVRKRAGECLGDERWESWSGSVSA